MDREHAMNRKAPYLNALVAPLLIALSSVVFAEDIDTLWDNLTIGVGVAAVDYPHYPGSSQSDTLVAPLPYLEYSGDWLSIDRDGVQAALFKSERFELDISVSGSLPVNNDDNRLREGMDDLGLIIEVGPELEVSLSEWGNNRLQLHLPLRAAIELLGEDSVNTAGWVFDPRLHYQWNKNDLEFEVDLGAYWASREYNQLIYGVGPVDVTPVRSLYSADSGLVGYRLSTTLQYDVNNWSFLAYARYMDLASSANETSPLFEDDRYALFGLGAIWRFKIAGQ